MKSVLNLYKPVGITPLQLIEKFVDKHPEYKGQKLGYAGRLDPMAEGILLILVGEENKKRKEYEKLPKEYEFDVLFGIKTDSYDVLGKIVSCPPCHAELVSVSQKILNQVQNDIPKYMGKRLQEYPPYSSPRVNGKPLFWWAREGRLSEIEIPKKEIEIYKFEILKSYELTAKELKKFITEKISKVKGTFRKEEILKEWEEFFKEFPCCHAEFISASTEILNQVQNDKERFKIFKFSIFCSSGTYVRSITNELGGTAVNIKRIRVGSFDIKESLRIDSI